MAQQAPAPAPSDQTATTTTTTTTTTALPANGPAAQPADQTVELSPFEVTSERDTGYAATDTLAGTRIRTPLADVGAAISVYNKDFLDDINATGGATLLQYTTNAEVSGVYGSYTGLGNGQSVNEVTNLINPEAAQRIRGLAAADNARNYFITDIPWDSFNTSRVDILRGPNSILYGLGSPAGIINGSTNSAEFHNEGSFNFESDSWGSLRSTFDLNQQLIPGVLAIRLDAEGGDQKFEQKQAFSNDNRYYGALRFDPQLFKNREFHTSIKASFEHGDINADRPRDVPPQDGITAYWRPAAVSAANPFGGQGQQSVNNPYDPWRTDNIVAGNGYGSVSTSSVNYQPFLSDQANAQQPIFFMDGASGALLEAYGSYIHTGVVNSAGAIQGDAQGINGRVNSGMDYGLSALSSAAIGLGLPGNQFGIYKNQSLEDPSIFNFYRNLIDGPTADQWEAWNAFNFDFTQTGWDDRVALDITYDRQKYNRGGQNLIGGSPTLTLDVTKNLADYYLTGANGETSITNANYGRPFVSGAGNNGGSAYNSDREVKRASLFVEVRPSDFTSNSFLLSLIGKQRFNGVASEEYYYDQQYTWQEYANSLAWSNYWTQNAGISEPISDRPPVAMIYLGNSVINSASSSNLHIPGITSNVTLPNASVYNFNESYANYSQPFAAAWTPPASLAQVYPAVNMPTTGWTQSSNPANYVGWTNTQDNLVTSNNGSNTALYHVDQLAERVTKSYSTNYQGSFWNDAFIATLGWRFDDVETRNATAAPEPLDQGEYDTTAQDFKLPNTFAPNQIVKGHSTSGGAVLHLNRLFKSDPLPFNVSLSYNQSKNFQVTSIRRDIYGNPFGDPTGSTKEYGIRLSTKNGKYSIAIDNYKTDVLNGSSTLGNASGAGTIIQQGMRYRNVFLYQLGGYVLSTENQPASRNTWTSAYPTETIAQAAAEEDAAITTWNNVQTYMTQKGFFAAWNYTPTTPSVLTTRTQYLTNPAAYQPDPATVAAYSGSAPQGFTVTADAASKGNELDLTANPLPNWRISINGAETTAVQNNVGGASLTSYVNYINPLIYNADGSLTPAGKMPQFGNPSFALGPNIWAPWLQSYTLLKLQEGTDDPELRKWRFNVITNYTFNEGMLKNFGVGGGYRWQSKVEIGYPVNTTTGAETIGSPYYGPALGAIDLWVSYSHKISRNIDWKIQLNVRNAFANNQLIPISIEPDGHTWATVRAAPVQDLELNNTFTF